MPEIDFEGEVYSLLHGEGQDTDLTEEFDLDFPVWDVLKEIDRRSRRAGRKRSSVKRPDKRIDIRKYMREHPDYVEKLKSEWFNELKEGGE